MATSVLLQPRFACLILLALPPLGCKPANKFVEPPPPKVSVAQPVQQDVVNSIEFTGTTRAMKSVEIRARVTGYLDQVAFKDGADVKEGELLFVIDQAPFQAERDISSANLQKAEATLELAEANLARTMQLAKQNASSAQQVDLSKAERSTAAANVKAAEAQLKQAELNLSYTEIRSPINGRIGSHMIDAGNLVQSEQSVLAIIESVDPIHVYFYVGERDLLWFMQMLRENKLPDPAKTPPRLQMRLENETEYKHEGHLDYRALGVDPQTGTVLRRALFPNSDGFLIPGLFVHIRAPIGTGLPKLLVEERAIGTDQRGDYILIVNDKNVVEYRPIKTGIAVGDLRVIEEGVAKDEWLVVNGLQRARPGITVAPEKTVTKVSAADKKTAEAESAKKPAAKPEPKSTAESQESPQPSTQQVATEPDEKSDVSAEQKAVSPETTPSVSPKPDSPANETKPAESNQQK
jgi:RND family efflux transporter MFP subunit